LGDKSETNGRVDSGGSQSQNQSPQSPSNTNATFQALLEQIPSPMRGFVEKLLPQVVQFIDSRIEQKLNELIPRLGEVTKQAIQDIIKNSGSPGQAPQIGQALQNQAPQGTQELSQRDLVVASLLQSILSKRGGLEEDLKRFAEIKAIAESIAGRGVDVMEIFKIYRSGMIDTIRMLYLMTRKKFPLEKLIMEEEEGKGVEGK